LLDENWGNYQHKIETNKWEIIRPSVIKSLQELLIKYQNWEIVIAIGNSENTEQRPMGLVIRDDEIIDGLQRQYLPKEFRNLEYEGSRPAGSRLGDIVYSGWPVRS